MTGLAKAATSSVCIWKTSLLARSLKEAHPSIPWAAQSHGVALESWKTRAQSTHFKNFGSVAMHSSATNKCPTLTFPQRPDHFTATRIRRALTKVSWLICGCKRMLICKSDWQQSAQVVRHRGVPLVPPIGLRIDCVNEWGRIRSLVSSVDRLLGVSGGSVTTLQYRSIEDFNTFANCCYSHRTLNSLQSEFTLRGHVLSQLEVGISPILSFADP